MIFILTTNQFKKFDNYKIIDYQKFYSDNEIKENNVAATLLKISERKTAKGNPYALLKLTDLSSVFELFIFSDVLELNRENLKEGSSFILTLNKTFSSDDDKTKRINVRKIASLKDLFNASIKEITLNLSSESQLKDVKIFLDEKGETLVNINFSRETKTTRFKLKSPRNVDRKLINILRNKQISLNIH